MSEVPRRVRVAVVGPCASGKTTLVRNLTAHGIDAHISGQEHSEIGSLWQRLDADILIALRVDLATLRERRGPSWSETLYRTQLRRLQPAYAAADLMLDTGDLPEDEVVRQVLRFLEARHEVDRQVR